MSMDLADPVSSGKYSGAFVFTATVAEPTVMSFIVPLNGYSIVATATVVTSCLRRDVVWWWFFTPGGAYDSVWDSVRPMTGNYLFNYFQYQEVVGCVCMLNYWFISNDEIWPDYFNYSRFKSKGKCRSEKWEVYLDRAHDQYQEDVVCVCMLYDWISCYDGICTDNHNYSWFKLKGKCRSEKWEVYLFGHVVDMPAVVNDRCPMVQTVQKTVEIYAQLQYI